MSLFFRPPPSSSSSAPLDCPPTLTHIFLQPLSRSASSLARSHPEAILAALASRPGSLVRTGEVISLAGTTDEHDGRMRAFRVVMTEPTLSGIVLPAGSDDEEGNKPTEVIVGPHQPDGEDRSSSPSESDSDGTIHPRSTTSGSSAADESNFEDDDDDVEISASFLQQALLGPSTQPSAAGTSSPRSLATAAPLFPTTTAGRTMLNPRPLSRPRLSHASHPGRAEDEEMRGWVQTRVLGEVGAFDGDWVAVRSEDVEGEGESRAGGMAGDWRIVRICAQDSDSEAEGDDVADSISSSILLPPLLLHNLSSHTSPSPIRQSTPLVIVPAPFLASAPRPPLPTATSVTLARLASPASTNKLLQAQVVQSLRRWFDGGMSILKVGDVIGVGVGEFDVREDGEEEQVDGADAVEMSALPSLTTTVCFVVTKIALDSASSSATTSASATPSHPSRETWDLKASRGDFGFFVDPSATQLVQAGIKHGVGLGGSVPRWLGIGGLLPPSTTLPAVSSLQSIVSSALSSSSMAAYGLQLSVLIKGARGSGKRTIVRSVASSSGVGVMEVNCFDVVGDTDAKTEGVLRARFERAGGCSPCVLLLRNVEALARKGQVLETGKEPQIATVLRECIEGVDKVWKESGWPVLVVGTTSDADKVPLGILACFKRDIAVEAPDERQRLEILTAVLADTPVAADVDLTAIAVQTAALVAQDIVSLVARAKRAAVQRLQAIRAASSLQSLAHAGVALSAADFSTALDSARTAYSQSIGAPKIPNVTWDDVGGLASVKTEILDTIELPLKHPELFAKGLKKRSGILLYGPPGTGKTLLAKAVATSCSLNFFSVKGPELLNMYIGESEANVRRVFQRARDARPCVIFFDELDSVAPKRGNQGDSGGVMDRIVSQLLAELDGMDGGDAGGGGGVFVIGATNRPDLLDPALLRPGRFDRLLYLGVSTTHKAQQNILETLTRKFKLDPDLSLAHVAEQCPFNYTGADLYALCADAMLKAMSRKAEEIDRKLADLNSLPPSPTSPHPHPLTPQYYLSELASPSEIAVLVGPRDFELALSELVPSVSRAEMEHYRRVQREFSPEAMKAVVATTEVEGATEGDKEVEDGDVGVVGAEREDDWLGQLGPVLVNGHGSGEGKGKGKGKARA